MRWEDCVKRELERVGGKWRATAIDRSWRLMIANAVRERLRKERKDKRNMSVTMANLTPNDRDNKRRTAATAN